MDKRKIPKKKERIFSWEVQRRFSRGSRAAWSDVVAA